MNNMAGRMTKYVLKAINGRGYVAKNGYRSSYTRVLSLAQKFESKENAIANACIESEFPVPLEQILDEYRR